MATIIWASDAPRESRSCATATTNTQRNTTTVERRAGRTDCVGRRQSVTTMTRCRADGGRSGGVRAARHLPHCYHTTVVVGGPTSTATAGRSVGRSVGQPAGRRFVVGTRLANLTTDALLVILLQRRALLPPLLLVFTTASAIRSWHSDRVTTTSRPGGFRPNKRRAPSIRPCPSY